MHQLFTRESNLSCKETTASIKAGHLCPQDTRKQSHTQNKELLLLLNCFKSSRVYSLSTIQQQGSSKSFTPEKQTPIMKQAMIITKQISQSENVAFQHRLLLI